MLVIQYIVQYVLRYVTQYVTQYVIQYVGRYTMYIFYISVYYEHFYTPVFNIRVVCPLLGINNSQYV